jgi:hypothetical protein
MPLKLVNPHVWYTLKRTWRDEAETNDEDVSLGVGQWPDIVVVLVGIGIPNLELNLLAAYQHARCAFPVIRRGREGGPYIPQDKTSLSDTRITDNNALEVSHSPLC